LGSVDDSRREIASFYAHVTHETGHFCYIKEIDGPSKDYYNENATQCPCNPTKGYFGRGPIQLSWNSNYRPAGTAITSLLNAPETVANDPVISFKTVLDQQSPTCSSSRLWCNNLECDGANGATVKGRVRCYTEYCRRLDVVDPGNNLTC
ncbi:unnamed protein product, partial [Brassica oleracea var. botrytis]